MVTERVRQIVIAAIVAGGLLCLATGYFCYTRFYRYQEEVARIIRAIPASARVISLEAREVFEKLDGKSINWIATKCLLHELAPARIRMSEWNIRGAIWEHLLPTRLSREDIMAVYTHCIGSREFRGIAKLSNHMYRKRPSELTAAEAIGILVVFRQPRLTPERNPEGFRQDVERLTKRYRGAG